MWQKLLLSTAYATIGLLLLSGSIIAAENAPAQTETRALTPQQIDKRLSPLRQLASAMDDVGTQKFSAIYSGVEIVAETNKVIVYVTELRQTSALLDAAKKSNPRMDFGHVAFVGAKYSHEALEAGVAQVWEEADANLPEDIKVYSVAVPADGSGLEISTSNVDTAYTLLAKPRAHARAAQAPVPGSPKGVQAFAAPAPPQGIAPEDLHFRQGRPLVSHVNRTDDASPFKGGALIQTPEGRCTSGFGAQDEQGVTYLITASHCGSKGDRVKNGRSRVIGSIALRDDNPTVDLAAVRTSASPYIFINQKTVRRVKNAGKSFKGDVLCQSGYASNVECDIRVTDNSVTYRLDGFNRTLRGAQGVKDTWTIFGNCPTPSPFGTCTVVRPGDSGGPVWVRRGGKVQARGIVSAGEQGFFGESETVIWATASDFSVLGLSVLK